MSHPRKLKNRSEKNMKKIIKKVLTFVFPYGIFNFVVKRKCLRTGKYLGVWLSLARAPGLGPGGRRFESCHPDMCGCSSMVEHQPSKLDTWVRFPSPACGKFKSFRFQAFRTDKPFRKERAVRASVISPAALLFGVPFIVCP